VLLLVLQVCGRLDRAFQTMGSQFLELDIRRRLDRAVQGGNLFLEPDIRRGLDRAFQTVGGQFLELDVRRGLDRAFQAVGGLFLEPDIRWGLDRAVQGICSLSCVAAKGSQGNQSGEHEQNGNCILTHDIFSFW